MSPSTAVHLAVQIRDTDRRACRPYSKTPPEPEQLTEDPDQVTCGVCPTTIAYRSLAGRRVSAEEGQRQYRRFRDELAAADSPLPTNRPGPSFDVNAADHKLITGIVNRLTAARPNLMPDLDAQTTVLMDLTVCHANGCRLDLQRMLDWPRVSDLVHDVVGINRHLNRDTGRLTDLFRPRFAAPQVTA